MLKKLLLLSMLSGSSVAVADPSPMQLMLKGMAINASTHLLNWTTNQNGVPTWFHNNVHPYANHIIKAVIFLGHYTAARTYWQAHQAQCKKDEAQQKLSSQE